MKVKDPKEKPQQKIYDPHKIENKWRQVWEQSKIYQPNLDSAKKPFYNLMMFPYPSAEGLHVGSVFTFTGVDTYGRFKRMQGYDVFEPIGLDGFGIHSENYALKTGRHPKEQAKISEKNFYRQLSSLGNSFDWSRKLQTYDSNYYKWTQWIFIQLFKKGLAYRKKAPVNFCPKDLTVLADEQVIDGRCERCGSIVEKRELEQWFFKITNYAERLLNNIPKLNWTEKVKIAQREWIGKKEGTLIKFTIKDSGFKNGEIEVFTTRGDTLYGATFLVLAPEHPISASIKDQKVQKYIKQVKSKKEIERTAQDKEKTGIFSGLYVINPLNKEELPVWIAEYVLMSYGTGALFGDAHDERDVELAKKYKIPLKPTIITGDKEKDKRIMNLDECYTGYGTLVDSGEFSGLSSKEAMDRVTEWLVKKGKGGRQVNYHLRDWLISRQRYWGPPIPVIYCQNCAQKGLSWFSTAESKKDQDSGFKIQDLRRQKDPKSSIINHNSDDMAGWFPISEEDLPVLLPDVEDWKPKGNGTSPLANMKDFVNTTCPNCGGAARRETDVSDTFLDSSWYFLRYLATEFTSVPFPSKKFSEYSKNSASQEIRQSDTYDNQKVRSTESSEFFEAMERSDKWLPVHMYIGGAEHSVLHLLYSRFITMVFKDMGLISFEEPYSRFYAHGLIIKDGAKMSKSRGNVVNPDDYLEKYGADTIRAYLRFVGPFDMGGDFRDSGIEGMHKFLRKVWKLVINNSFKDEKTVDPYLNKLIKEITEEVEKLRFNTAFARIMMYYNFLAKKQTQKHITKEEILIFIKLLAPFVPFMAEELWQRTRNQEPGIRKELKSGHNSVHVQPWPIYDEALMKSDTITIVVQINGKTRATFIANVNLKQEELEKKAKNLQNIKKHLGNGKIKKVIYVPGEILNFVIAS